jgi:hypothetical protein
LKNDVNVPSRSNKQKNFLKNNLEGQMTKIAGFGGMDPLIRIRTKISWIRNTD